MLKGGVCDNESLQYHGKVDTDDTSLCPALAKRYQSNIHHFYTGVISGKKSFFSIKYQN